jgi:protein-disulfide isomerase
MFAFASIAGVALLAVAAVLFVLPGTTTRANSLPLGTNNVRGLASAPVEIENWSDFQCPHCKTFAVGIGQQLAPLVEDGTVRVVFRHMAFLGDESVQAAAASECAAEQGQFWPYHDTLMAEQRGRGAGTFSKPNLKRFGAELGLDTASFEGCVDNDLAVARVRAETQAGERKGVKSTPTIFVNGEKLEGVPNWETLRRTIEQSAALVPVPGRTGS